MKFPLVPLEFEYEVRDAIHFPAGKLTNILRGALGLELRRQGCRADCEDSKRCTSPEGLCLYQQLFEGETGDARPSGFRDAAPRPFVLRSSVWQEHTVKPGDRLVTALHMFDLRGEALQAMIRAHARVGEKGLGSGRGKLRLLEIRQPGAAATAEPGVLLWKSGGAMQRPNLLVFDLSSRVAAVGNRIRVEFTTPTEIKAGGEIVRDASFGLLFARLRERILFLMSSYSQQPIDSEEADAILEEAKEIVTVRQELRDISLERYSTRTGQTHPLSGFVGEAEYEGDFSRLWPWLMASEWTGIGRQTVWGKGAMRWVELPQRG